MFFGGGGFPFPGMDGGMPGRGGKAGRGREDVDTTKFYKVLEVDKGAGDSEIKKAYRKLAVKHHPDKGGDPEKFKEITQAYEVLSEETAKRAYDAMLMLREARPLLPGLPPCGMCDGCQLFVGSPVDGRFWPSPDRKHHLGN